MCSITCCVPLKGKRAEGSLVLCYAEAWGQGGIETFLMELFRRFQGKGFAFALYSCWDWNDAFDAELGALGIDRYTVFRGEKPGQARRLRDGSASFDKLLAAIKPDAVYINTMNGMGFLYSEVAKRRRVPIRVVHSHNSALGAGQAVAKAAMHGLGRALFGGSATACLACSADAGRHLFGQHGFEVVNNGVEIDRFAFDPEARALIRERFGIPSDALLFGSVGKLAEVKNPFFQIRTFAEILRSEPSAYYLMVGDGDMREQVKELVGELGLENKVIMPGYLPNPAPVYSALDCFLMPSLFEGLANVRIEAQCARCAIVCSEALPPEAHITDAEVLLPLSAGEKAWAEKALEMAHMRGDRTAYAELVREAGFDADDTARQVASMLGGCC